MQNSSETHFARRELIGLVVEVERLGLKGQVVDETKNTFLVETPSGVKRVPKIGNRFVFRVGMEAHEVDGDMIAFRPEDRTKKVRG